jgi:DNA-binding transcriptional ArsR family regulator
MSQKQPYIYTMPEQFLTDVGVPARWKVLAVVQGFWIAGKTMYATNEWLQQKLGYSRRQIQNALSELEEMGLVSRSIQGMNRVIYPGGATGVHGGVQSNDKKGAVGVHHNSDSISVSKKAEDKSSVPHLIVSDAPQSKKTTTPRSTAALRLREKLYGMFEAEYDVRPTTSQADYQRVLAALQVLSEKDIIDLVEDALEEGKVKTVREALTNRAIDIYRQENA